MFLLLILNIPTARRGVHNEFKVCATSTQMFFNVMFFETKDELVMTLILQNKTIQCAILYGASNEPEAYLEPSQTSTREHFGQNIFA